MTTAFASALEGASQSTSASEASPASTPAQEPVSEPPAPAATTQAESVPPTPESANAGDPEKAPTGEPPKWRWQDILANARETTAKETEARIRQEVEQRYQWAKDIADYERDGLLTWRAAMNGDPRAVAALKANPQAVTWLKGLVAEPQAPQADPEPEPDLQTADGTPVYSAGQQAKREAWLERKFLAKLDERVKPFEQDRQQTQAERANAAYQTTTASVIAKMAAADPEFKAHTKQVAEAIQADGRLLRMAIGDGQPPDPEGALEIAWSRVYRATVLPAKANTSEASVLANLQQRAVAATANPSGPAPSAPKKFSRGEQGFAEALEHFSQPGR